MKRYLFLVIFGIFFFTSFSLSSAKGYPDRISVARVGVDKPIDITDSQILQNFSPWDEQYFDRHKGPLSLNPDPNSIYEIVMYTRNNNDEQQAIYAFYYSPGEPGYIYIPGKGDSWHEINIVTISRGSTIEGRWFYASSEWGDIMHQILPTGINKDLSANQQPEASNIYSMWRRLSIGVIAIK